MRARSLADNAGTYMCTAAAQRASRAWLRAARLPAGNCQASTPITWLSRSITKRRTWHWVRTCTPRRRALSARARNSAEPDMPVPLVRCPGAAAASTA